MSISVLMSVYAKDNPFYLDRAIKSISFDQIKKPSEIIIVVDGPVGSGIKIVLENWKNNLDEDFLKLVYSPKNLGLASSLNLGFKFSTGDFIARMDSDDVSMPNRFLDQYYYLMNNSVDIIGGQIIEFGSNIENQISIRRLPIFHIDLVNFMKFRSPFSHPSIMFRRNVFIDIGGYDSRYFPEDYEFFVRAYMAGFIFHNLESNVLWFRLGENYEETLKRRWGHEYFKRELALYWHFYKIDYFSLFDFFTVSILKLPLRLLPFRIFKYIYFKKFR
ncbi:MAG: glycosyltransferase [Sediminibacterium sp.]